jgi:predicted PurR-regulated permease PerM
MLDEILKNTIIAVCTVILVIIILFLIGFFVIPYLWEKLNLTELIIQKFKEVIGL